MSPGLGIEPKLEPDHSYPEAVWSRVSKGGGKEDGHVWNTGIEFEQQSLTVVQSGNGESSVQSEAASSSFFHGKCRHGCGSLKGQLQSILRLESRAKEGNLFRDEEWMKIQIFINRTNKIGGWPYPLSHVLGTTRMKSGYSNAKLLYLLSSRLVRRLACRSLDSVIMKGCQLLETAGCVLLKSRKLLRYLIPKIPLHAVEGRKL